MLFGSIFNSTIDNGMYVVVSRCNMKLNFIFIIYYTYFNILLFSNRIQYELITQCIVLDFYPDSDIIHVKNLLENSVSAIFPPVRLVSSLSSFFDIGSECLKTRADALTAKKNLFQFFHSMTDLSLYKSLSASVLVLHIRSRCVNDDKKNTIVT